jgi:hypothetical protein
LGCLGIENFYSNSLKIGSAIGLGSKALQRASRDLAIDLVQPDARRLSCPDRIRLVVDISLRKGKLVRTA